jgi:flagellar basal body P-ring formation protein FlgA
MWRCLVASMWLLASQSISIVQAQNAELLPVPVRSIFPGETLQQSDFAMKLFQVTEAQRLSFAFELGQLQDMEAARTLAVGKPIPLRAIKTVEDVQKGQPAAAIYVADTVEIQGTLVPLTGGSSGQTIEARNPASGSIVRAKVMANGKLMVLAK